MPFGFEVSDSAFFWACHQQLTHTGQSAALLSVSADHDSASSGGIRFPLPEFPVLRDRFVREDSAVVWLALSPLALLPVTSPTYLLRCHPRMLQVILYCPSGSAGYGLATRVTDASCSRNAYSVADFSRGRSFGTPAPRRLACQCSSELNTVVMAITASPAGIFCLGPVFRVAWLWPLSYHHPQRLFGFADKAFKELAQLSTTPNGSNSWAFSSGQRSI